MVCMSAPWCAWCRGFVRTLSPAAGRSPAQYAELNTRWDGYQEQPCGEPAARRAATRQTAERARRRVAPSPRRRRPAGVCSGGMAPSIGSRADGGRGPQRLGLRVAARSQPRTSAARCIPGRPACRPPAHTPTCRGRSRPARCRRRSGRRSCGGRIDGQPESAAGGGQFLGRW